MNLVLNNPKEVVEALSKKISNILYKKEFVVMALPGGRSVKSLFKNLIKSSIPWKKIKIFMVDERLVNLDDKESNFRLIKENFLDYIDIPFENIYPYKQDLKEYKKHLIKQGGKFDIVILGSGEDGHIAGLFPNYTIKDDSDYFIEFHDSPKPPKHRMTTSKNLIMKSEFAIVIFLGEAKKKAYEKFNDENTKTENCPVKIIKKIKDYIVYTDLQK